MAIADTPDGPVLLDPAVLSAVRTKDDVALRTAWQRYLEYSTASDKRKQTQEAVRLAILLLSVLVVILAVVSTYLATERGRLEVMAGIPAAASAIEAAAPEALNPVNQTQTLGGLCAIMRQPTAAECLGSVNNLIELNKIILIALPLIIAGTLTWMMQFMPGTAWIGYRIGAELVRYQLYLYRMEAGDYTGKTSSEQQEQLLERVKQARRRVDQLGSSEPYTLPIPADLGTAVKAKCNDARDDGFSQLSVDEYLLYRIRPQREWYVKKLHRNYGDLRTWRAGVLFMTGIGAFLVAVGFEPWVAVTTSIATAAGIFIDLKMYGRTYAIYHTAVMELDEEVARWLALPQERKDEAAEVSDFVKRVEDILQRERERWMQQAMQSQAASEQGLLRNVNLANSPFRVAEGINRDNDIPASVPAAQSVRASALATQTTAQAAIPVSVSAPALDPAPTPTTPMSAPTAASAPAAPPAPASSTGGATAPFGQPRSAQAPPPRPAAAPPATPPARPVPVTASQTVPAVAAASAASAAGTGPQATPAPAVVRAAPPSSPRPAPPAPPELDVLPPSS
ncbi:MAG: SLATT domain-containing protein [Anaerolineae bacterium]|nr:SLATT domain-containing protein [Anaerolineae bacterium]